MPITGVFAIIHANKVDAILSSGDVEGARAQAKKARMWVNISAGIFLLLVGGSMVMTILAEMAR